MRSAQPGRRTEDDLIFVSNRGHIYGTGGFWRMKVEPGAESHARFITKRQRGRPGRISHLTASALCTRHISAASGISSGSCHRKAAIRFPFRTETSTIPTLAGRPTAQRIAFISNRGGNTSLWVQDVLGGAQHPVVAQRKALSECDGAFEHHHSGSFRKDRLRPAFRSLVKTAGLMLPTMRGCMPKTISSVQKARLKATTSTARGRRS